MSSDPEITGSLFTATALATKQTSLWSGERELAVLEIKSGQTVARDSFQGLHRFARVAGDRVRGGAVVYRGSKGQARSDWEVWPIHELRTLCDRTFSLFTDRSHAFMKRMTLFSDEPDFIPACGLPACAGMVRKHQAVISRQGLFAAEVSNILFEIPNQFLTSYSEPEPPPKKGGRPSRLSR